MLKHKKVRLTEENMQYEDLVVLDLFSEDEVTYAWDRANIKGRKDKSAFIKSKILKQQVIDMKQFQIDGMKALVDTISSIDENSKKILFKHFDHTNVNIMKQRLPDLLNRQTFDYDNLDSDEMESDSSGNNSDGDEINRTERLRMRQHRVEHTDDEMVEEEIFSEEKVPEKTNGINILHLMEEKEDPGFEQKEDLSDEEIKFSKPASM